MFIFGVILASIFHIWTEYGEILRIQSEYGKIQTRITPNTDTSYAVMLLMLSWWKCNFSRYVAAEFESVLRVCNAILLCIFPLPTFYSLYSQHFYKTTNFGNYWKESSGKQELLQSQWDVIANCSLYKMICQLVQFWPFCPFIAYEKSGSEGFSGFFRGCKM